VIGGRWRHKADESFLVLFFKKERKRFFLKKEAKTFIHKKPGGG
jgi:hypothetical protein